MVTGSLHFLGFSLIGGFCGFRISGICGTLLKSPLTSCSFFHTVLGKRTGEPFCVYTLLSPYLRRPHTKFFFSTTENHLRQAPFAHTATSTGFDFQTTLFFPSIQTLKALRKSKKKITKEVSRTAKIIRAVKHIDKKNTSCELNRYKEKKKIKNLKWVR